MKHITKGNEPEAWRAHRETPGTTFEAIPELKNALLEEQGYLCCYCMSRITYENMKVEHFKPRRFSESLMDYSNLLAACQGNSCDECHCDTNKADVEISINPTDKEHNCETIISYKANGKIVFPEEFKTDVEDVLNLNNVVLVANRKAALDTVLSLLSKKGDRSFSAGSLQKTLHKYTEKDKNGKYNPFCQIVVWWLSKKLK